jgi:tRNA(adenine34) deaminase
VFATADPKAGMCGSLADLVRDPRLNHAVEVEAGLAAEQASGLLKRFFAARRAAEAGARPGPGEVS